MSRHNDQKTVLTDEGTLGNAAKMTTGRRRRVVQKTEVKDRMRKDRDRGVLPVVTGLMPLLSEA